MFMDPLYATQLKDFKEFGSVLQTYSRKLLIYEQWIYSQKSRGPPGGSQGITGCPRTTGWVTLLEKLDIISIKDQFKSK